MEKRNGILLIIIAAATLLVTVAETSFAFSASSQSGAELSIPEKGTESVASFSTLYDKDVNITVNANAGLGSMVMDSSNLSVKLLASNEGEKSKCTYDIIYVWNSEPNQGLEIVDNTLQDKYYIKTATVEKELTISGKADIKSETDNSSMEIIAPSLTETNIDKFPLLTRTSANENINFFVLVNDAVISSTSTSTPTEVNWNFELRFYNVNKDQIHLNGKRFGGYITVDQKSIEC